MINLVTWAISEHHLVWPLQVPRDSTAKGRPPFLSSLWPCIGPACLIYSMQRRVWATISEKDGSQWWGATRSPIFLPRFSLLWAFGHQMRWNTKCIQMPSFTMKHSITSRLQRWMPGYIEPSETYSYWEFISWTSAVTCWKHSLLNNGTTVPIRWTLVKYGQLVNCWILLAVYSLMPSE